MIKIIATLFVLTGLVAWHRHMEAIHEFIGNFARESAERLRDGT